MQIFEKYLNNLPIIPEVASKIMSIREDNEDYSFKNLEEIISIDPMLTSRILKVANSALYSRQKEITTLQMAIGLLGFKNIKSLVLLLTASQFSKKLISDDFYTNFWKHSIVTAFVAREIYNRNKDRADQDMAFILGLLHDIGRVALFNADPEGYKKILDHAVKHSKKILPVEKEFLKADHQEVGAAVMKHWNLPEIFVDIAREHGNLNVFSKHKKMIRNITVADMISEQLGYGSEEKHGPHFFEQIRKESDVKDEDLEFFLKDYNAQMVEDNLFKECEELFLIGKK
ncbi:MAG: HDOD domain-containing protein [Spirochaetaceae bacterium]|nr:HDOD domain-containing protein [Spirochaetaceae bacterium]